LLAEGIEVSRHGAVIAGIHQRLVKTGRISVEHGRSLNWLFELRGIGDYGMTAHVSEADAQAAITAAESFVRAIRRLLTPSL